MGAVIGTEEDEVHAQEVDLLLALSISLAIGKPGCREEDIPVCLA